MVTEWRRDGAIEKHDQAEQTVRADLDDVAVTIDVDVPVSCQIILTRRLLWAACSSGNPAAAAAAHVCFCSTSAHILSCLTRPFRAVNWGRSPCVGGPAVLHATATPRWTPLLCVVKIIEVHWEDANWGR